jgi:mRNA interferase RelE/StbE
MTDSGGSMDQGRYELRITPAAQKEIDRLPSKQRTRVESAIEELAENPRPFGCLKMQGIDNTYRIRIGNYRVIYQIHDKELVVLVVAVGDRKDIYCG